MPDELHQSAKPRLGDRFSLWGYRAFCALLRITDVRAVALFGRGAGYLVWLCARRRRRIVERNLRIVLDPTLRRDKLAPMVRRNMVRTTMNLLCSLKTGLMSEREMEKSIRVLGRDSFENHGTDGQCGIACIPHAGNWEALARIRPCFPKVEHYGSMYRRLSNPLMERLVYKARTRYGCEMLSKEDGLRAVLRFAKGGGLLGVLSDQFTNEGVYVPYFNKITGVTPLPALLYRRCKGKGTLFSVFTRNTGLGRWDAEMGRVIHVPEGCDGTVALTILVNRALEKCQMENILDGFWMHHRWKSTARFVPEQDAEDWKLAMDRPGLLPFRIIVCVPEEFEEALPLIPALRVLAACRPDAQLNIACPQEQLAFWNTQDFVAHAVSTDAATPASAQLEEDELYREGPYDYLFMFSENRRVFRDLTRRLGPLYVSGFAENPLAKRKHAFRSTFTGLHFAAPRHRALDYLTLLEKEHHITLPPLRYAQENYGSATAEGDFIAPFSTLGEADSWAEEKWAELCARLYAPTLLALPQDGERADAMARRLGIPCRTCAPEELRLHLGPHCRLFAVDGLLPQLAALCGTPCTVIMASRLAERYRPLGEGHRTVYRHRPCHPCHRSACDQASPCTAEIVPDDLLR
ncbi:MAG: hypothetical protein Q4C88_02640 [Akkermansia sp.]|nr:hypothetical protein [Akkermansia sp.]